MNSEKNTKIQSHPSEKNTGTGETRESSRSLLTFQEYDPFSEFIEQIDKNEERRQAVPEEIERMNARLLALGQLFEGLGSRWHIDGALNISLANGKYIGVHKDIDVSIELDEIELIGKQLKIKGYDFFLSYPEDPSNPDSKKIMERVDIDRFSKERIGSLNIAAIDAEGRIRRDTNLNVIDVHLVDRNVHGKLIGASDVELPDSWAEVRSVEFRGQRINLEHPAQTAYFKLHQERAYDMSDLKALAKTGTLSIDDVNDIESIFEQENILRKQRVFSMLERFIGKLEPEMSASEILNVFLQEPALRKASEEAGTREKFVIFAEKIEASDKSKNEVTRLAFEIFNIESSFRDLFKKIEELRKWVAGDVNTQNV